MGSRTRGRPPTRWIDDVENDLKILNIKNWQRVAAYRWNWRKRVVEAAKTCNRAVLSWQIGRVPAEFSQTIGSRKLSKSCDRHLWGNNHHTCKDPCATLNYCVVPAWIAHRPLTSRETLSPLLAGCNEMLKRATP
ncbi:endonuclease-reverse transcriptase [Trichonephila clavipes]|nr:endonuclease-reverse transcriptase [Trichonephila clavipes]